MKSLYLFLITLTAFMSISNFAHGSPDQSDQGNTNEEQEKEKFTEFLSSLPLGKDLNEALKEIEDCLLKFPENK